MSGCQSYAHISRRSYQLISHGGNTRLLGLLTIKHPITAATTGQAIIRRDTSFNHTTRCSKRLRLEGEVRLTTGNIVIGVITHTAYICHNTMPDRSGAGNTDNIVHRDIISVTGPDPYHRTGSVTNGQVVLEVIRCTCL